jgi:L-ascorbate metabolism protein UlaG (beta-lactamase superfamily)
MRIFKIIFLVFFVLSVFTALFINLSPQFGSNPSSYQKKIYSRFGNYVNGEFKNDEPTKLFTEEMSMANFFKDHPNQVPKKDIIPMELDIESFKSHSNGKFKLSWLGHSAFIMNLGGNIILLDPMLGQFAAPVPVPSLKRYSTQIAFSVEDIDTIDMVVYSHDHYDHLDYSTIKKIKGKVGLFIVPHGVGNHLRSWEVPEQSIIELNWNDSKEINGIEFVCLPARHFSGRGPFNRNSTLWSSWAIKSEHGKIYFSGDSGYGKHLKKIGDEHGPFDISLIDCGQYNKAWKYSHMFPEQSLKATKDLKGEYLIPIHWGAFTLSTHSWIEPPEKVFANAEKLGQKIILPQIGQIISMKQTNYKIKKWWKEFN